MAPRLRIVSLAGLLMALLAVAVVARGGDGGMSLLGAERATAEHDHEGGGADHEHGEHDQADHDREGARSKASTDPARGQRQFTFGDEVRISDSAIEPAELVSPAGSEVRLHNDGTAPVEIDFLNWFPNGDGQSRRVPILPGDAYVVRSASSISIVYEVVGRPDLRGSILIEQPTP